MKTAKNILIINPFGIGDVLFTTPLVSNLRQFYPKSFIGYIANSRALPVLENNPKIDKVYVYEHGEFKKDPLRCWGALYRQIRTQKIDLVFDLSLNETFGFFGMVCGISKRVGYDYRGRGRFLTHKFPLLGYEDKHVVQYYLDLLQELGLPYQEYKMELPLQTQHQQWAKDWVSSKGIDLNKPVVAVIPGGGASWGQNALQKRWPAAQYALLVDKIIAKTGAAVILMGDTKEQILCEELARQCSFPVYNAVGETSVLQMAALLQLCRLAIVNDGGPLHIAVAAGVKTVSIFGSVDPVVYGPYPAQGHVVIQKGLVCQPCYRRFHKAACSHLNCLNQLEIQEVYRKVEVLL